jgi:polysaccharide biosynthesis transport protein
LIGPKYSLPVAATEQSPYAISFPPDEAEPTGGGFTLVQLWRMLRAHLLLSVAAFLLMLVIAFAVIKWLMPKSYEATAALIVNTDITDPLAGRNQGTYLTYTFFPTQMELINNNVVLRPVVDRLKLLENRWFTGGFAGEPKVLREVVLAKLRSSLRVQPGQASQLLYISATTLDPALSAKIANAVAEEYLQQISQRNNAPAMERAKRYADQLAELKEKADVAQSKVEEFRNQYGMADLKDGQNGDNEGAALAELQSKLIQAQNQRRILEAQGNTPDEFNLRSRLNQLETDLRQAGATLGPKHPRVLQLQSEIEATTAALSGNTSAQMDRARALENRFVAAVAQERERLLARRSLQDEGAKLLLEQQSAKENYAQALRGQDQVQFASVGNYKDVTLVSRAEPPLKASKPNKMKLFLAAMMASFVLAVGGPFAYELLVNRRIRCRDDLERHFRIVTLAQFGRMDPAPAA